AKSFFARREELQQRRRTSPRQRRRKIRRPRGRPRRQKRARHLRSRPHPRRSHGLQSHQGSLLPFVRRSPPQTMIRPPLRPFRLVGGFLTRFFSFSFFSCPSSVPSVLILALSLLPPPSNSKSPSSP